jgi:predicted nucleic acid-binding protein
VAISAKEADKEPQASAKLAQLTALGYEFFAPGLLVSESLYVLCKKLDSGLLTSANHAQAVSDFHTLMSFVQPAPQGEVSLVLRSEAIRGSYSCRRSADGLYIALAEELAATRPTILLTFDEDMAKQAARAAPAVTVELLT